MDELYRDLGFDSLRDENTDPNIARGLIFNEF